VSELPPGSRASEIARRRTEEERAEAFFPLRATTTAADSKSDARANKSKLDRAEADVSGVFLAQIDVGDLRYRNQHLAPAFVGECENSVAADRY
jgi:hypothetical protein